MVITDAECRGEAVAAAPTPPPAQPPPDPIHPFSFDWSIDNGFGSSDLEGGGGPIPLPAEIGEERMTAWMLGDGAGLFDHGFKLKRQLSITGTKVIPQGVLFLRTGLTSASHVRRDGLAAFTEAADQYSLHLSCTPGATCTITYGAEQPAMGLAPIITEDRLRTILRGHEVPKRIERFLDGRGEDFAANPRSSATMRRLAHEVRSNPYRGGMSVLFLQGKLFEMLAEALADLADSDQSDGGGLCLDHRRAMAAHDLLMADPLNPPSIERVAHLVGLSQRRLNAAFRAAYGLTVWEWLVEWRLNHARELLRQGGVPIKEIAFRLGYGHVSNFTAAFVRRFGVAPGNYRQSVLSVHVPGGTAS